MRKKITRNVVFCLLTFCLLISLLPTAVLADAGEQTAFTPKRMFIVSQSDPKGTELAQKVSLAAAEFQVKGICDSMKIVYGEPASAKEDDILIEISDTLAKESYEISLEDGKVFLTAGSPVGALYGLRSMLKVKMLGGEIADASETPDIGQRIFHLDCGRKYFSKEWILSLIKEISWLNMNQLELDFSNGTGFRFALNDMSLDVDGDGESDEDLSVLPGGDTDPTSYLGESDMDEIIQTAQEYGVEIVPCLDTPGHTGWIFGKEPFRKYGPDGDLDVENAEAVAFIKALVKKYAAYFVSKGCTTFHVGGDEYLHGYYNWGTPVASTEEKYGAVADYLDSLAAELKELGIKKVRSFNDCLYYNSDTQTHTWQNVDEAEYWCYNGMNSFRYAAPGFLAERGLGMINGHGDFYDILTGGDDNWKKPVGDAGTKKTPAGIYSQFRNHIFAGNQTVEDPYVVGSTYFLWCDDPTQGTQEEVAASLYTRLRSASEKMQNDAASGTYEEFAQTFTSSAGGFSSDGTVQDITLPETEPIVSAEDEEKPPVEPDPDTYDISEALISAIPAQFFTGKALTPSLSVTYYGKALKDGVDYTASYANNTNIGTASVTILGKGDYYGTKKASFSIRIQEKSVWEIDQFRYQITDAQNKTVSVTGAAEKKTSITIKPAVVIGGVSFRITEIGAKAFTGNSKLKRAVIGQNIEKIGAKAFFRCKNLKSIQIKTQKLKAKNVGKKAFAKTSPKSVIKVPKKKKTAYRKFLYKKGVLKSAGIK